MVSRVIALLLIILIYCPLISIQNEGQNEAYLPMNLTTVDPIRIENTEDFQSISTSGSGSASDPFIIQNLAIEGDANISCVEISDTSDHFIIRNCVIANATEFGCGFDLDDVRNGIIDSCIVENCTLGVSLFQCISVMISYCELNDVIAGFSIDYCTLCTILGNWIVNSRESGIYGQGVWIYEGSDIWIEGNIIRGHDIAIFSNNAEDVIVRNNTLVLNSYGFQLFGCLYWRIYNNSIGWNDINVVVGFGYRSYWNNSNIGNKWSDYGGEGTYTIDALNIDYFPSELEMSMPIVGDSPHLEIIEGDPNTHLEWSAHEPYPFTYSISNGSHIIEEGYWNGNNVRLNVSGFIAGTYSFKLTVTNLLGLSQEADGFLVVSEPVAQPIYLIVVFMAIPLLFIIAIVLHRAKSIKLQKDFKKRMTRILVLIGNVLLLIAMITFARQSESWHWLAELYAIYALAIGSIADAVSLLATRSSIITKHNGKGTNENDEPMRRIYETHDMVKDIHDRTVGGSKPESIEVDDEIMALSKKVAKNFDDIHSLPDDKKKQVLHFIVSTSEDARELNDSFQRLAKIFPDDFDLVTAIIDRIPYWSDQIVGNALHQFLKKSTDNRVPDVIYEVATDPRRDQVGPSRPFRNAYFSLLGEYGRRDHIRRLIELRERERNNRIRMYIDRTIEYLRGRFPEPENMMTERLKAGFHGELERIRNKLSGGNYPMIDTVPLTQLIDNPSFQKLPAKMQEKIASIGTALREHNTLRMKANPWLRKRASGEGYPIPDQHVGDVIIGFISDLEITSQRTIGIIDEALEQF